MVTTREEWFLSLTFQQLLQLYRELSPSCEIHAKVRKLLEEIEGQPIQSDWPRPRT